MTSDQFARSPQFAAMRSYEMRQNALFMGALATAEAAFSAKEADDRANQLRALYRHETPADHSDWTVLADVLATTGLIDSPQRQHIDAFFDDLPADIVGPAVALTFGDSDVLEDLLHHVQTHRERLIVLLNREPTAATQLTSSPEISR